MSFRDEPEVIPRVELREAPGVASNKGKLKHERAMEQDSMNAYQRDVSGETANRKVPWFVQRRMNRRAKKIQR